MKLKYKRVLLKVSGESLATPNNSGINFDYVLEMCSKIKECYDLGVEIGIVVGGGNFWRGRSNRQMERVTSDHIGMLGTTMNALAMGDAFKQVGADVRILTAVQMREFAEHYVKNRAIRHLEKGRILVLGSGTGNAFFSTDTAAALRAAEIGADIIIKLSTVDGIYDSDPKINSNAKKYDTVTYEEVLDKNLKVMDATAVALCRDNNTPIMVIDMTNLDNLIKAVKGEKIGTIVVNKEG